LAKTCIINAQLKTFEDYQMPSNKTGNKGHRPTDGNTAIESFSSEELTDLKFISKYLHDYVATAIAAGNPRTTVEIHEKKQELYASIKKITGQRYNSQLAWTIVTGILTLGIALFFTWPKLKVADKARNYIQTISHTAKEKEHLTSYDQTRQMHYSLLLLQTKSYAILKEDDLKYKESLTCPVLTDDEYAKIKTLRTKLTQKVQAGKKGATNSQGERHKETSHIFSTETPISSYNKITMTENQYNRFELLLNAIREEAAGNSLNMSQLAEAYKQSKLASSKSVEGIKSEQMLMPSSLNGVYVFNKNGKALPFFDSSNTFWATPSQAESLEELKQYINKTPDPTTSNFDFVRSN